MAAAAAEEPAAGNGHAGAGMISETEVAESSVREDGEDEAHVKTELADDDLPDFSEDLPEVAEIREPARSPGELREAPALRNDNRPAGLE